VIRMLNEILAPGFEVEFIVESKTIARRLHDAGVHVVAGDPRRTDTYLKADITPGACIIIEDSGKRSLRKTLESVRDAAARWSTSSASASARRQPKRTSKNCTRTSPTWSTCRWRSWSADPS